MLYHLLYPLRHVSGFFNLFRYITFRGAYGGALSLTFILLFGGKIIRFIRRRAIGETIREELPDRHREKKGTPTMGGVLILSSMLISILLFADLTNIFILLSLFVILSFGMIGFIDDIMKMKNPRGLSQWVKLGIETVISFIIALLLYYGSPEPVLRGVTNFIFFKNIVIDMGILYIPFATIVMVSSINAVNFTDGLDGLASGLLGIAGASYAVFLYIAGHTKLADYLNVIYIKGVGELTVVSLIFTGAIIGFLWFNSYPAEIFMGDTGSLALGAMVGFFALAAKQEILLLLVGGVFVMEAGSVLLQVLSFRLFGRRIFKMAPIHHHFELKGWKEPKIVTRFWILGLLFALIAISTLKIR